MTQTLEQLFKDLCATHDLKAISVAYNTDCDVIGPDYGWYCNAHYDDSQVASRSAGNAVEAIRKTIELAQQERAREIRLLADISVELAA